MLVKLTLYNGDSVWVNPAYVTTVIESEFSPGNIDIEQTFAEDRIVTVYGTLDEVAAKLNGEDPCKS